MLAAEQQEAQAARAAAAADSSAPAARGSAKKVRRKRVNIIDQVLMGSLNESEALIAQYLSLIGASFLLCDRRPRLARLHSCNKK